MNKIFSLFGVVALTLSLSGCQTQNFVEPHPSYDIAPGTKAIVLRWNSDGVSGIIKFSYSNHESQTENLDYSEVGDDTITMEPGDTASITLIPKSLDETIKDRSLSCKIVEMTWTNEDIEVSEDDPVLSAPALSQSKGDGTKSVNCSWKFKS